MDPHPSQRRISCERCRRRKVKCQRLQPDDPRCIPCVFANAACHQGEQGKVGRPKRTQGDSPCPTQTRPPKRRQRQSAAPKSNPTAIGEPNGCDELHAHPLPSVGEMREAALQMLTTEDDVLLPYATDQTRAPMSFSLSSVPERLPWPTFVTDDWYQKMLPAAVGASVPLHSFASLPLGGNGAKPRTPSTWNGSTRTPYSPSSHPPHSLDRPIDIPRSSIDPGLQLGADFSSRSCFGKETDPLPFGVGKPPAYYIHENKFSTTPEDVPPCDTGPGGSHAMARLINIVYGLRLRSALVRSNGAKTTLHHMIHRRGPLFLGSYSLSEYVTTATQELIQIADVLAQNPGTTDRHGAQLRASIISTAIDVYRRLLSFFQLLLEYLIDSVERIATDPVIPIAGLSFNGRAVNEPCAQGTLFTSTVCHLLERLEVVLGISAESTNALFSDQADKLVEALDRSPDLDQIKGIMRPADMRRLYEQVATVLEGMAELEARPWHS